MREIKFRGKRVDNGEWVYGDLIHGIIGDYHIQDLKSDGYTGPIEVVPETVGQYSGRKDKTGVEIYGGDTVSHAQGVGVVEYSEKGTRFGARGTKPHYITKAPVAKMWTLLNCRIIGNIHD